MTLAMMVVAAPSICPDCEYAIVPCGICGGERCECRPAEAECRYVHWRDGAPVQLSVPEASRRLTRKRHTENRCEACGEHRQS